MEKCVLDFLGEVEYNICNLLSNEKKNVSGCANVRKRKNNKRSYEYDKMLNTTDSGRREYGSSFY